MQSIEPVRTALFVPAHKPRAIEKARGLGADLVILDLEDAVPKGEKAAAREGLADAVAPGFGRSRVAVRVNADGSGHHESDCRALPGLAIDCVVVPKVEAPGSAERVGNAVGRPVLAMIESPAGVLAAPAIAGAARVIGLLAGTNDLAHALRLPPACARPGLRHALSAIVLAARAAGVLAIDGVFNRLDDPDGLAEEAREGRSLGFDGKSLIHPAHLGPIRAAFAPTPEELDDARALVAAATAGAERFRGRMVEAMHVEAARRLLAEGGGNGGSASL